jgi:hypothetical protein
VTPSIAEILRDVLAGRITIATAEAAIEQHLILAAARDDSREFFAAHAPEQVPAWFQFVPTEPMPAIPGFQHLTATQMEQWRGLGDYLEPDQVDPIVVEFAKEQKAAQEAQAAWRTQREVAAYFAWRWCYADNMLTARDAR